MSSLKAIQGQLAVHGLDAILLLSASAQRYACGYSGSGFVLVGREAAVCCVSEMEKREAESCIEDMPVLVEERDYPAALKRIAEKQGLHLIGFEESRMTIAELWAYQKDRSFRLIPAENLIFELRLVKSAVEQTMLRRAQSLTEAAYLAVLPEIRPGIRESRIRGAIARELFRAGADGLAFPPVAAFGERSAFPHGLPGDAVLHEGEMVLLDMGCVLDGYQSDLSRTVCCGRATEEQKHCYHAVAEAKEAAAQELRGNAAGESLYRAASDVLESHGYSGSLLHALGHGIGLETHEGPEIKEMTIPVGSAFALEPGLYFPKAFGIRIEDVYLVTEAGNTPLSQAPGHLLELCT